MPGTAEHATTSTIVSRRSFHGALIELSVILILLPLLVEVVISLTGRDGAANYVKWWAAARGWRVLWSTLQVAGLAGLFATVLAWILASTAARCSRRAAALGALLSCLPMLVPSSLLVTAWVACVGKQGFPGRFLASIGFDVYSALSASIVLAMRYFGVAVVVLTYHLTREGSDHPASRVYRIPFHVRWGRLKLHPAIRVLLVAGLLVMLLAMNDHIIPDLLLVGTLGPQLIIQYSALMDPGGAAALAIPVAVLGVGMVCLSLKIAGRTWISSSNSVSSPPHRSIIRRLSAGAITFGILGLVMGIPLTALIDQAGSWRAVMTVMLDARSQLWNTLLCAVIAGPICVILGSILANRWVCCERSGSFTTAPLVLLNLIVAPTLLGIGVIQLFQYQPLRAYANSIAPLITAYVLRFLPVATLGFFAAWRHESPLDQLAARVHGVTRWRTAWCVVWPQRRKILLVGTVLIGLLTATELEMSILLSAPGKATLGIRLYSLIHTAPTSVVSALTLGILVLATPGIILLVCLIWRKRW